MLNIDFNNWTTARKVSLAVHLTVAIVIMIWSVGASITFWLSVYKDEIFAYATVFIIDFMALFGMGLRVFRIKSPIQALRLLLPYVSVIPLYIELYDQFSKLDNFYRMILTISIVLILIVLTFFVWRTIERLFVDDLTASSEMIEDKIKQLGDTVIMLDRASTQLHNFASYVTPGAITERRPAQIEDISNLIIQESDDEIINMKDVEGLTFDQIGTRLGITRQTASIRYQKAKTRSR